MKDPVSALKALFPRPLHDRLFLVGGMVRDLLMGVECQDVDLAAAVTPQELAPLGFRPVSPISTPGIQFLFHREFGKIELTLIPSPEALADDLARRDFTVNAIAMTLDGMVVDPLDGRRELAGRVLSMCSADSFRRDPGRIFRALRFECDGWRLDRGAEEAITAEKWNDRLALLPVERFSGEMLKALAKPDPCRFFRRMLQLGVGEAFLPELFRMTAVPAGPPEHHPEGDLCTHSLEVLERVALATPDPKARFCGFLHDLGKLATPPELYPKHHGHDHAGAEAAAPLCRRLRLPLQLLRALEATCRLHNSANRWGELRAATKVKLAQQAVKGGIVETLPFVVAADFGAELTDWRRAVEVAGLSALQLGLDQAVLQGMPAEKCQQLIMQRRVEALKILPNLDNHTV